MSQQLAKIEKLISLEKQVALLELRNSINDRIRIVQQNLEGLPYFGEREDFLVQNAFLKAYKEILHLVQLKINKLDETFGDIE